MNTFGFNINLKNSPEEILELGESCLADGSYGAIEVTYYEDMQNVDTFAYNQAIRTIVRKYNPEVVVHISAFNTSEENSVLRSAIIHEFINCCEYTKALGGKKIVMHSGRKQYSLHVPTIASCKNHNGKDAEYQRAWELSIDMFRICCDIAKQYGITIFTENLGPIHLTVRCDELVKFVKEVKRDNLFIVFDIGHCHYTGGDIAAEVVECGHLLHHLHLHDNMGDKDSHLPVGEGNIDYTSFCDALKKVDYPGFYMMELDHCTPENVRSSRERLLSCIE